MEYIVRVENYDQLGFNNPHGKYLRQGDSQFEYTSNIYRARTFKTKDTAQKRANDIYNKDVLRYAKVPRETKVVGIKIIEVDI